MENRTGGYLLYGLVKNPAASCLGLHNLSEAKFRSNGVICEMEEVSKQGVTITSHCSHPGTQMRQNNKQQNTVQLGTERLSLKQG